MILLNYKLLELTSRERFNMKKPKFIFYEAFSHWLDDSGGSVYIYSGTELAYVWAFSFFAAGINRYDSERTMTRKANEFERKI